MKELQKLTNDPRTPEEKEHGDIVVIIPKHQVAFGVQALSVAASKLFDEASYKEFLGGLLQLNETLNKYTDYVYDL